MDFRKSAFSEVNNSSRTEASNSCSPSEEDYCGFIQSTQSLPTYLEHRFRDQEPPKNWKIGMSTNQNYARSQFYHPQEDTGKEKLPPSPPKKRWTVTYDNRNYIRSQFSKEIVNQLIADKRKVEEEKSKIWKIPKPSRDEGD